MSSQVDATPVTSEDDASEKCWICLEPETPQDGLRHFCKCSLVAHDRCVMHWALEIESSPGSGYAVSRPLTEPTVFQAFKCPQCGSTICIRSKKSFWLLRLRKNLDRFDKSLFVGATLTTLSASLGWSVYFSFYSFGVAAINSVCPPELAAKALGFSRTGNTVRFLPLTVKRLIGIPIIPVVLFLSTFRNKPVSVLLTTLPLALFRNFFWRLSGPEFTLSVLPFIREVYQAVCELTIERLLSKWAADCIQNRQRLIGAAAQDTSTDSDAQQEETTGAVTTVDDVPPNFNDPTTEALPTTTTATTTTAMTPDVQGLSFTIGLNELSMQAIVGDDAGNPVVTDGDDANRMNNMSGNWLIGAPSYITKAGHALLLPAVSGLAGAALNLVPWVRKTVPDQFNRNILGGILVIAIRDIVNVGTAYMRVISYNDLHIEPYDGEVASSDAASPPLTQ